jgi:tetratricopeptide (TPR) repeat protein
VEILVGERLHERFGLPGPAASYSRIFLAGCLAELGAFAERIAHGEEACRIAEAVGISFTIIVTLRSLGRLYLGKGDLSQAISVLERDLVRCQGANLPDQLVQIRAALGYAYALSGRVVEALPQLEQAVEQVPHLTTYHHAFVAVHLGEAFLLAGHIQDARAHAEPALALAQDRKQRGFQAHALRLLGAIAMHRDPSEIEQAKTHYHQALTLANELGMRPLQAHCHRGLGILYSQTGQAEQAHAELSTAIEMYRDMEMTFWLPETESALAAVEGKA